MSRKLVWVLAMVLVVAGCGDDDFADDDDVPRSTTAEQAERERVEELASQSTVPAGASDGESQTGGSSDDCELAPSSVERPSIGKVGSSLDPSLIPEGVSSREVGFALITLVDQGELCLEDVVAYVNQVEETDDFRAALEGVLADLTAPSG